MLELELILFREKTFMIQNSSCNVIVTCLTSELEMLVGIEGVILKLLSNENCRTSILHIVEIEISECFETGVKLKRDHTQM